jgi:hypothetical protein
MILKRILVRICPTAKNKEVVTLSFNRSNYYIHDLTSYEDDMLSFLQRSLIILGYTYTYTIYDPLPAKTVELGIIYFLPTLNVFSQSAVYDASKHCQKSG